MSSLFSFLQHFNGLLRKASVVYVQIYCIWLLLYLTSMMRGKMGHKGNYCRSFEYCRYTSFSTCYGNGTNKFFKGREKIWIGPFIPPWKGRYVCCVSAVLCTPSLQNIVGSPQHHAEETFSTVRAGKPFKLDWKIDKTK